MSLAQFAINIKMLNVNPMFQNMTVGNIIFPSYLYNQVESFCLPQDLDRLLLSQPTKLYNSRDKTL